jgi:hypothetical protein
VPLGTSGGERLTIGSMIDLSVAQIADTRGGALEQQLSALS